MNPALVLILATASGVTLSGIVANIYRLVASKADSGNERIVYFAVMVFAGPNVLFGNSTRSLLTRKCSIPGYLFATAIATYWSFALGLFFLYTAMALAKLQPQLV